MSVALITYFCLYPLFWLRYSLHSLVEVLDSAVYSCLLWLSRAVLLVSEWTFDCLLNLGSITLIRRCQELVGLGIGMHRRLLFQQEWTRSVGA
jgi:hypothetical protein